VPKSNKEKQKIRKTEAKSKKRSTWNNNKKTPENTENTEKEKKLFHVEQCTNKTQTCYTTYLDMLCSI